MNILEYVDYLIEECGIDEEYAYELADFEYSVYEETSRRYGKYKEVM